MTAHSHLGDLATSPDDFSGTAAGAYRSSAQNIGPGWTRIVVNAAAFDPHSRFDLANGWYVVPSTGAYLAAGVVAANFGTAPVNLIAAIYSNGFEALRGSRMQCPVGLYNAVVTGILYVNAGDHVELRSWDDAPGEAGLEISYIQNRLSVVRVG